MLSLVPLFSGVALLSYFIAGVSLPLALAATAGGGAVAIAWGGARLPAEERRRLARTAGLGVGLGIIATLVYDGLKLVLSQLDPSPFDPFEAVHQFGFLLVGRQASDAVVRLSGLSFHLLNGVMFGVGYLLLFARDGRTTRRRALTTGVVWGLFLETLQLTFYPGWLDIRFYSEFVQISALSHIAYGAVLGLGGRAVLRRLGHGNATG